MTTNTTEREQQLALKHLLLLMIPNNQEARRSWAHFLHELADLFGHLAIHDKPRESSK